MDRLTTLIGVLYRSPTSKQSLCSTSASFYDEAFVEMVIWRLPEAARGSEHRLKYRLALVVGGECVLRYDNEAGKGDHRHVRDGEQEYSFISPERLLQDFWTDVDAWRAE